MLGVRFVGSGRLPAVMARFGPRGSLFGRPVSVRSWSSVGLPQRDEEEPLQKNEGSGSSLFSIYSKIKSVVKDEAGGNRKTSPEWEREVKTAKNLVQKRVGTTLDPRELVGKDLSMLTQNIQKLIDTNHPVLQTAARYYFDQGGKHFRPLLVLLMSLATNRCLGAAHQDSSVILPPQKRLAEITEMIHTASLLHDDVIDIADTRRGNPSANINYGNKVAVLAGDFLLARASVALAQLQNLRVVELLATVIANLVEGEVMQMKLDTKNLLNFDYYIQKTYLKTATLIAKSCQAAVILAGQQEEISDIAYQYGRNFGIAFQLVDDILDFTGTADELGKPAAADLELGLVTAPVLFALEEHPELLPLVQRQFQQKGDPAKAREIVLRSAGIKKTRAMAEDYCQRAVDAVMRLPESDARTCLVNLTQKAILRNH